MSCCLNLTRFEERELKELFYIGFNQENSCLATGDEKGFRIFTFHPYKEANRRDTNGGLGHVEMLFRSNIVGLVGGGSKSAFDRNKVILWDDAQQQPIGELSFKSEVKGVKMRRDRIVVCLMSSIHVYGYEKLERTHRFNCYSNQYAVLAVTPAGTCVVAFPSTEKGKCCIEFLDEKRTMVIQCHEGEISCMALSRDGSRLATTSKKGTLVRVFNTARGDLVKEVRRGSEKATMYNLSFNTDASLVACYSSTGTIHIFQTVGGQTDEVEEGGQQGGPKNRRSKLSVLGKAVPYLMSEWSFAWHKMEKDTPGICSFGVSKKSGKGCLYTMTCEGEFYELEFDEKRGGSCVVNKAMAFYKEKEEKE